MADQLPVPPIPLVRKGAAPVDLNGDDNPFKLVSRYKKARAIATTLLQLGADATSADSLADSQLARQLAGRAAGVNTPSETTWALVVELVREVRPS